MYKITKEFNFDYGHRVWSQKLNTELSDDKICACRHIHGHRGRVLVTLQGEKLKDGMIFDFKNLDFIKRFINDVIDHKFIIDEHDPLLPILIKDMDVDMTVSENYCVPKIKDNDIQVVKELKEGMIIVDFIPTSENLSRWLYEIISNKLEKFNVKVYSVQFFETPKSNSLYYEN